MSTPERDAVTPVSDELLQRFVLGDVGEDEQARVEDALFASDDVLARITTEEHALCADYVLDALDGPRRARLEERLTEVPHLREKVTFHRALAAAAGAASRSSASTARRPGPRLVSRTWPAPRVIAAAMTLAVAAGVPLALHFGRGADGPREPVARLVLVPRETRGEVTVARVARPRGEPTLPLDLVLSTPERFARYRVVIRRGTRTVWSAVVASAPTASAVAIDVPTGAVAPGLHAIELLGIDSSGHDDAVAWFEVDVAP